MPLLQLSCIQQSAQRLGEILEAGRIERVVNPAAIVLVSLGCHQAGLP